MNVKNDVTQTSGLINLQNIDFTILGSEIEKALINAKIWEEENRIDIQLQINNVIEDFMGCEKSKIYIYHDAIKIPLSLNKLALLSDFINKNYINRDKMVADYIESKRQYKSMWGIMKFQYYVGLQYDKIIKLNGKIYHIPKQGLTFFEDKEGARFLLNHRKDNVGGVEEVWSFQLYSNCQPSEAQLKIIKFFDDLEKYCKEFNMFKKGAFDINGDSIDIDPIDWNQLKITKDQFNKIKFHILEFLEKIDKIEESGLKTARGIILSGKPGNGKTMLGKILATNINFPILWVTAEQIMQRHDFKNTLTQIYKFAEQISPSIIFIEDADIFLSNRQTSTNNSLLSQFLNTIDGLKENKNIVTIITANNPELLDEAVNNRPKRFDCLIEFKNPEFEQRYDLLSDILTPYVKEQEIIFIQEIAQYLDGLSGAHVVEFAERLIMTLIFTKKSYIDLQIINETFDSFGFKDLKINREVGFK